MKNSAGNGEERSFTLPLHSSLVLDCRGVDAVVEAEMRDALGGFSDTVTLAPDPTVITVALSRDLERFQASLRRRKNPDAYWVDEDRGEPVLVFRHRDRASLVVRLGPAVVLEYEERPAIAKRVVDCLFTALQVALSRRGDLFFKGAVTLHEEACAAMVGTGGAGKTSLLLRLLHDGWNYLSDDTFLLIGGTACGLRRYIAYWDHHVRTMPEIFRPARLEDPLRLRSRRALRSLLARSLPVDALGVRKLRRLYDPVHRVQPEQLFPRIRVVASAVPSAWILLRPGNEARLSPLPTPVAVDRALAAELLFFPRLESIGHQLEVMGLGTDFDLRPAIEQALYGRETWELTLPRGEEAGRTYERVRGDLVSMLRSAARASSHVAIPAG